VAIFKLGIDAEYVLAGLLRSHLFPAHKADRSEIPPEFSSAGFTDDVAKALAASGGRSKGCGYDSVRYLSTRFNNVPRAMAIPHPVPHARLALCIHENWDSLRRISSNRNSFIRPRLYPDGRLFTMEYGGGPKRVTKELKRGFGKRFLVKADVSNCYPSVYTHSIAWAAVGKYEAKVRRTEHTAWFNVLDMRVREAKRNETHGIVIGPATSSIIAEFILGRVDEALRSEFNHVRFIDDFQAFCETEEEALHFVRRLSQELRKHELELNARKTSINPLPTTSSPDWVHQLSLWKPERSPELTVYDVTNYLDLALSMAHREPDGSVLKYAVKAIRAQKKRTDALLALISYTLNLSFHNPVLIPLVDHMFDEMVSRGYPLAYGDSIERLILHYAESGNADALCWALHFAARHGLTLGIELGAAIVRMADCCSMVMLRTIGDDDAKQQVLEFAQNLIGGVVAEIDKYELDQYWILLYELYLDGEITNPYVNESAFDILQAAGVRFVL
jgi:hypothetical protein